MRKKVVSRERLIEIVDGDRACDRVLCNGVFDLVHVGHARMLRWASELGDSLIVAVNSDASVRQLQKGADRPIIPQSDRAEMIATMGFVDWVYIFDESTPIDVVNIVRPIVLCKAADWANRPIVGREEVESWGGRVEIIPLEPGYSTTSLIERIRNFGDKEIMPCGHLKKFGGFHGPNWRTDCQLCYMSNEMKVKNLDSRNAAIDESLEIYEESFEKNWVVQDCIDRIKALKR